MATVAISDLTTVQAVETRFRDNGRTCQSSGGGTRPVTVEDSSAVWGEGRLSLHCRDNSFWLLAGQFFLDLLKLLLRAMDRGSELGFQEMTIGQLD